MQVDGGSYRSSLGLRANGTLWAWGCNSNGALGDNTTVAKSSPVSVVGGFTDWIQVSGGRDFSLGLRANGTAWAWGFATSGQLGDNSTVNKSSPVSVEGGFTDWVQLTGGGLHSLGVRVDGTAWAWGAGGEGRLGSGNTSTRSSPVSVVGGFTDWVQVNAGGAHSHGLRANGTVWSWGCNNYGRLGDNTTVSTNSPVSVVGGFTDWVQVDAGNIHGFAIRSAIV
jgi:alpha-tubulin suppressor-like RCC1 family protein